MRWHRLNNIYIDSNWLVYHDITRYFHMWCAFSSPVQYPCILLTQYWISVLLLEYVFRLLSPVLEIVYSDHKFGFLALQFCQQIDCTAHVVVILTFHRDYLWQQISIIWGRKESIPRWSNVTMITDLYTLSYTTNVSKNMNSDSGISNTSFSGTFTRGSKWRTASYLLRQYTNKKRLLWIPYKAKNPSHKFFLTKSPPWNVWYDIG